MDNLMEQPFGSYSFQNVWGEKSSETIQAIVDFWASLNALPANELPEERAKQLVYLIKGSKGDMAGVCTAYASEIPSLGFKMYFFRCLIHPDHRQHHLAAELLLRTRLFLNEITDPNAPNACKGVIVESENTIVNQVKNEAIWAYSGLVYIGRSKRGFPIRVHYFDGAKIGN